MASEPQILQEWMPGSKLNIMKNSFKNDKQDKGHRIQYFIMDKLT